MESKYATIVGLEAILKQVEEDYCFAAREGDREAMESFYEERGEVIRKLQNVK